jgi:RNA polymerase sigma-70 factor (ECF subfamily)
MLKKNAHILIASAKTGDHAALNKLFTEWYPRVYNWGYRYFGDEEMAAEISQQAFMVMQQKLKQLQDPGSFKSWLYRTVLNLCHNETRRRKINNKAVERLTYRSQRDTAPAPDHLYMIKERSQQVLAALARLPEEQRTVVIMKEYEDLKFREIAEILNISENTAKSRLYYAYKAMRKFFLTQPQTKAIRYE